MGEKFIKSVKSILKGLFYCFAAIAGLVILSSGIFLFQMRTREKNVSFDPQYSEIYGQTFEVQKELFILQWSDSKEYYFKNWEASDALAKVEKGTRLSVKKVILRINPFAFVSSSLKVLVEIQDPRFSAYNKKRIDASSLIINELDLPYSNGIAQFDPEYLRNIEILTLHAAVQYGDLEAVKNLLERGAGINQKNFDGKTPLHYARELRIVEYLVDNRADVNLTDKWGKTLLHYLANDRLYYGENHYRDIVKLLIEKGAFLDQKDNEGNSPLLIAAEGKNYAIVKDLLNSGADPLAKGRHEETVLLHAALDNNLDIFELSLKLGADPNAKSGLTQMTALHFAVREGNMKMAKLLVDAGVQINAADDTGTIPLYFAVRNMQMMQFLIEKGADIHHTDQKGRTVFHEACYSSSFEEIKFLYEKGSQINLGDKEGTTHFHRAFVWQSPGIVKWLIEKGASINQADINGSTPLHMAVSRGDLDIIQLLLDNGASVDLADLNAVTPLSLAKRYKLNDIVEIMKKYKE